MQVEEEPEKAAWREAPEQLLRLAAEKLRRTALRKDGCLEEPEGRGRDGAACMGLGQTGGVRQDAGRAAGAFLPSP